MVGGVHESKKHMSAQVESCPEPPNVHDGPEKFIADLLAPVTGENEGCDSYQCRAGNCKPEKKTRFIDKLLKWSGIAFGISIGVLIIKKAFQQYFRGAGKVLEKVGSEAAKHIKV